MARATAASVAEEPAESSRRGRTAARPELRSPCDCLEQQPAQDTDASTVCTLDSISSSDSCRPENELTSSRRSSPFPSTSDGDVRRQIRACLQEASDGVMDWDVSGLSFTKTIQSAERNCGRVDKMQDIHGGKFAVKKMPTSWACKSQDEFHRVHGEQSEQPWYDIAVVKYLQGMNFTYAARHYGIFRDELNTYVVSELADGDAFSWCTHPRTPVPGPQREAASARIFRQMVSAVAWLHNLGIAHRDISLENVLLSKNPETGVRVKIIDFGMATSERFDNAVVGKPSYQAPEMHSETGQAYDCFRADAFSLGVALYALAMKDYPWNSTRAGRCRRFHAHCVLGFRGYIERRKLPQTQTTVMELMSEPLIDLVESLLEPCPAERITLGERCWETSLEERLLQVWDMPWMQSRS